MAEFFDQSSSSHSITKLQKISAKHTQARRSNIKSHLQNITTKARRAT
jgi:hypothetical protein